MKKEAYPVTPAVRLLRAHKVAFRPCLFTYEADGGSAAAMAAQACEVPEHTVVKTLIMEDENRNPLIILMHGDLEVSTKTLARLIKVRTVSPCNPKRAEKLSGYQVGGISPFGTLKTMPVYMQQSILDLPEICINGGKRGFCLYMDPAELIRLLGPVPVDVALS